MTIKWVKTAHKGLRYYEHPTYKHGKKKDRYYSIRFKVAGKDYTYGIGWWSEGVPEEASKNDPDIGFEEYCITQMKLFKANVKAGSGVKSPKEKREEAARKEIEMKEQRELSEKEAVTIADYFNQTYFPEIQSNKAKNTIRMECVLFNRWIKPIIGNIRLVELAQTDLQRVKQNMQNKNKSAKTIHHVLANIRQILNHAKHPEVYLRAKVKMPKVDNAKLRYLTADEIVTLLNSLKRKSNIVHDQAFIAVNCGLRFSEVAGLRWEDVNYETGTMSIRDAKTGSRTVFLNEGVTAILKARQQDNKRGLVFPMVSIRHEEKRGEPQERCSKTFQRVADELFNEGIEDRRLKITFHSLRHTFGTHVYENSGDLYLTQKALGHKTMTMAQRYAKMSESKLREAFMKMSEVMKKSELKAGYGDKFS